MTLLSITSDYGNSEYYLASLKASLYGALPDIQIIDITHEVPLHDLGFAAYQMTSCLHSFPQGSIHICCVNEFLYANQGLVVINESGQWFIIPNNGILHLIFENYENTPILISAPDNINGRQRTIIEIINQIIENPQSIKADSEHQLIEKFPIKPIISRNMIRAKVMHIDHYGNLILNISKELFHNFVGPNLFQLEFRRYIHRRGLQDALNEVEIGEILCFLGTGGYLTVAAFQERADELLDISIDETVNLIVTDH